MLAKVNIVNAVVDHLSQRRRETEAELKLAEGPLDLLQAMDRLTEIALLEDLVNAALLFNEAGVEDAKKDSNG